MTARHRRERRRDPLASREAVRRVIGRVRTALPPGVEMRDSDLVRAIRAASHCERTGWTAPGRGRKPAFPRPLLRAIWSALDVALRRERASGVSGRTFAENYLRLLACPPDVLAPLERGQINLFEALQLSRIRPPAPPVSEREAGDLRARVLSAHLAERASARQLAERVDALLGRERTPPVPPPRERAEPDPGDPTVDEFLADPGALFADQLRQVAAALSQVDPAVLSEAEVDELLDLLDQLYLRTLKASRKGRAG